MGLGVGGRQFRHARGDGGGKGGGEGSCRGTWGLPGRLLRGGKGVGRRGVVDGAFGRDGMKGFGIHLVFVTSYMSFVLLCYYSLQCISLHKVFGVNFESRDSDHTVVSRAPNNPGLDTSHVSKVLTAALEGSFV